MNIRDTSEIRNFTDMVFNMYFQVDHMHDNLLFCAPESNFFEKLDYVTYTDKEAQLLLFKAINKLEVAKISLMELEAFIHMHEFTENNE